MDSYMPRTVMVDCPKSDPGPPGTDEDMWVLGIPAVRRSGGRSDFLFR